MASHISQGDLGWFDPQIEAFLMARCVSGLETLFGERVTLFSDRDRSLGLS
mgnify:CR=1 FL=1